MEENKSSFRHEFKYIVSEAEIEILKQRISGLLQPDPHVGKSGIYNISSIYFDDYYNRCFYENENGVDPREKFRIRIYNHSDSRISLECKRKECGKTLKTSCLLTREQVDLLIESGHIPIADDTPAILKRFLLDTWEHGLKPVTIVEYDRKPYVYPIGNVRVTFDEHLSSSDDIASFFCAEKRERPVMPPGMQLMEVKYDEFLPDWIFNALQVDNLQQTAYSKYYLCRKYSLK